VQRANENDRPGGGEPTSHPSGTTPAEPPGPDGPPGAPNGWPRTMGADQPDALRSAVAAAHRLVTAVRRGARPGDGTADGAALATVIAVMERHLAPDALDKALAATRATLARRDGRADAAVGAMLDWADTLLGPISEDPAAATELSLTARTGSGEGEGDDPVDEHLVGRAAFRRGSAAHLDGRHGEARSWWELARRVGHDGARRALDSLAGLSGTITGDGPAGAPHRDPDVDDDARRLVGEVTDDGDRARAAGDLDTAADRYDHAAGLVREMAAAQPDEPGHREDLGRVLDILGDLLIDAGRPGDAVTALDEAERTYGTLRDGGAPRNQVAGWIAEVQLRRARAQDDAGHGASALVDTEAAVVAYLDRFTADADDPLALDLARALAQHAHIVLGNGDPDVAAAAAETALRLYLARADEINGSPGLRALHVPPFHGAAVIAWAAHTAAGRHELADTAADLAADTSGPGAPLFGEATTVASRAEGRVTLADALGRAGALALRATLVAPAADATILCSTHRCPPADAPTAALQLAGLVDNLIAADLAAGLRLALEAHVLFVGASRTRAANPRYPFDRLGPEWLAMLDTCSQACETAGQRELALDLARWMGVVGRRLGPRLGADPVLRDRVRWGLTWQAGLLHASGDAAGARQVAAAARALPNTAAM
jgi:tetratricopeptide (TPR) repeat protein